MTEKPFPTSPGYILSGKVTGVVCGLSSLQDAETQVTCYANRDQQAHVSESEFRRCDSARGDKQRIDSNLDLFLWRRTDTRLNARASRIPVRNSERIQYTVSFFSPSSFVPLFSVLTPLLRLPLATHVC